jgi:DNA invertase Pin-like site-specific DNA recombinase
VRSRERDGWRLLPDAYEDGGFTGANINRPGFQRLLDDVEAGRIDVVKVDRLSRSLLDFAQVMERFNRAGAAFVSVTQNFSTADAMGRLTLNMLMSFAEFEREMIAERTRDKIAAARRRGKWTGGSVPLGYQVIDKKLVVDEVEAVIVREVFALYREHGSALEVAHILNDRGRATKRHTANNGRLRKARPWTKDSVLRVLKNAIYAGLMPYGDEVHSGEHDAIVPEATWRQAQVQLRRQTRRTVTRPRNPDYLLRGLLRCVHCGAAFTPATTTRKGDRAYRYYLCITRDKQGRSACPAGPLPAAAIEDFVLARLHEATEGGALAADVRARITQLLDLLLLAPDIQEELLFTEVPPGRDPVTEHDLRQVVRTPLWADQRAMWAGLRPPK